MQFNKSNQLAKIYKNNPKKLKINEYKSKCDYIREHYPICQVCNASVAQDVHHAMWGAGGRDDRTIISICRECHYGIHASRHPIMRRAELIEVGVKNHTQWLESI